jgi:uncharacterized membrane protein
VSLGKDKHPKHCFPGLPVSIDGLTLIAEQNPGDPFAICRTVKYLNTRTNTVLYNIKKGVLVMNAVEVTVRKVREKLFGSASNYMDLTAEYQRID